MLTKPIGANEIEPPFHFPLPLRNTHFQKSLETTHRFLKITFFKKRKIKFGGSAECKWRESRGAEKGREPLKGWERKRQWWPSDPTKGNQRIKILMAGAMVFVVAFLLSFFYFLILCSRFNNNYFLRVSLYLTCDNENLPCCPSHFASKTKSMPLFFFVWAKIDFLFLKYFYNIFFFIFWINYYSVIYKLFMTIEL